MEWPLKKLSEVAEIISGGTPKTDISEYWGDDIFWITPADMGKIKGIYASDTRRKISNLGLSKSSAKLIPEGSVILSTRAPIGHLAINIVPMATNQGCRGLVSKGRIDTKYLFYFLLSNIDFLNELGTGTTFKELSKTALGKVKVPTPLINEQERIVAILDEAFADIEQVRAKTEQNLKNARELFESYLQQVFSQRGEGWVESELFDHVKFIDYRGKTPKKTEDGLRLITAKNVRMGFLKHEPAEFVAPESYGEWMTRGIPQKGDILFTTEAPLANVAQLDTDEKVVFAQRIITMQPDRSVINSDFLKYLLLSPPIQKKIHDKGTGATATGIKASLLKKIPIEYPSCINEQIKHVEIFDGLKESVNQLELIYQNKLQALDELKKSILQKAFSGELTQKNNQGAVA